MTSNELVTNGNRPRIRLKQTKSPTRTQTIQEIHLVQVLTLKTPSNHPTRVRHLHLRSVRQRKSPLLPRRRARRTVVLMTRPSVTFSSVVYRGSSTTNGYVGSLKNSVKLRAQMSSWTASPAALKGSSFFLLIPHCAHPNHSQFRLCPFHHC